MKYEFNLYNLFMGASKSFFGINLLKDSASHYAPIER